MNERAIGPEPRRDDLRGSWEVPGALVIMLMVLTILDLGWIREPVLLLSLAPLIYMILLGVRTSTWATAVAWTTGFAVLGAATWNWTYAALAWPAPVFAILHAVHRLVRKSP